MKGLKLHIILLILLAPSLLLAEAVFLKDGFIVEGEIVTNTATTVVIKSGGKERTFRGREILRVSYKDDYKNRKYIYLKNDQVIEGYIVGEDRYNYVIRKELESDDEQKVAKNRVNFVARKRIGSIAEPSFVINGDRTLFRNFLGVRLITGMVFPRDPFISVGESDAHWAPLGIGLYYYDRYFDAEVDFFLPMGGSGGVHLVMTGLPLNMFNVGLGIQLGYWFYYSNPDEGIGGAELPYFERDTEMAQFGLSYRLPNLFRIGISYLIDTGGEVTMMDAGDEYKPIFPAVNLLLDAEFFVWRGLSLKFSWLFSWFKMEEESTGSKKTYRSNTFYLSVGYGFRLAK